MVRKFDKITIFIFCISFLIDRITKYLILHDILQEQFINRFLNIDISNNYGIAWGIGNQCSQHAWLITIVVALALMYFAWQALQQTDQMVSYASTLIIAGGISNFIDRLLYGSVIDFIQVHVNDCYFPTFNIADICISIGACILLVALYHDKKR
ncbi:signal peptidase II [Candidatus Babeliales bacterium]|nr:signal peptidase II [Candidatus Babeliales bacterium]